MKITRLFILLSLTCLIHLSLPAQTSHNYSVLFGQREHLDTLSNVYRVFLDREGSYYPPYPISDSLMRAADASLAILHSSLPQADEQPPFAVYQDLLLASTLREVNGRLKAYDQAFVMIHGFRKPFESTIGGRPAWDEFRHLREKVTAELGAKASPLFIEVYWDATYDCCFSLKKKKNHAIFNLFQHEASQQAVKAGYGLRTFLAGLATDQLTIVSHSLGARVVAAATFNAYPELAPGGSSDEPVPNQKVVSLCLIAPAISGEVFQRYYQRPGRKLIAEDPYRLSIFYNRRDFVLRKKVLFFGPGPLKFGDTSLGVDHKRSIGHLTQLFELDYPQSTLSTYRVRRTKSHTLKSYINSGLFEDFLASLTKK